MVLGWRTMRIALRDLVRNVRKIVYRERHFGLPHRTV
jgi:hypothetical protein